MLAARGESFFADHLDLHSARQRQVFVKQAAEELGVGEDVVKKDLGKVLLALEGLQEKQIEEAQKPKEKTVSPPASPGTSSTGFTGDQGPTRWFADGSSP